MMQTTLTLRQSHLDEMIRHVSAQSPLEACGLLAGLDGRVESVLAVPNACQSPTRFRIDSLDQLRAFEWIDDHGLDLVGIFHSHPTGPETVSHIDIAEATYEVVQVVLSRQNGTWKARGFWIKDGQSTEVRLIIE